MVDVFLDDGCDASSIIASNLVHYSANIATIVTFFFSMIVLFYFCLNQWTFNDLVKDIFELYTGVLKIAVFTTLAWITTTVLICILPRVAALILRPCLHGVGDPGLVGWVSFVLCPLERENKRNQPH